MSLRAQEMALLPLLGACYIRVYDSSAVGDAIVALAETLEDRTFRTLAECKAPASETVRLLATTLSSNRQPTQQ